MGHKNRTKKREVVNNLFDMCKCKSIHDKYYNEIKPNSKVDPQPFKPPFMPISSDLWEVLYLFPWDLQLSLQVVMYILRWTWGMKGDADKKGISKIGFTMAETNLANMLHVSKKRVAAALEELIKARILLVEKHNGPRNPDGSMMSNYYFFNKHWDTWDWGNSDIVSGSVDSTTPASSTVGSSTVEGTTADSVELGLTEYLPIRDGAMVGLLELVDSSELKRIAIDATNTVKSQGLSMERYEGILFSEAKKLKEGK
jgi:hypothetical protein